MTFATIFPENIERLVINGVMDPIDYYLAGWAMNLRTMDKGLEIFADACVKAGLEKCCLHSSSNAAILSRIQGIVDSLKARPISVVTGNGFTDYGIVDYGMVRHTFVEFLYQPFAISAQNISMMLAGLEKGDGSLFWQNQIDPRNFLQCTDDPKVPRDTLGFSFLGTMAIACRDADLVNDTIPTLETWYKNNAKLSSFADVWPYRIMCAGWRTRAVDQSKGKVGANTSFSVMFIGNTADPVTPLANAHAMSKIFPKSSVLIVNSPGHISLTPTSAYSSLAVRAYFRDGLLPEPGTVCGINLDVFGDAVNNETVNTRRSGTIMGNVLRNIHLGRYGPL